MPDADGMLREGLQELSVPYPERAAALLDSYVDELERWNPRFGFVKYESREDLVVKHVLDSLSAWTAVRDAVPAGAAGSLIDVGSGAGLPGIPLAVVLPGWSVTLLERMARRAAFLRTCALLLRLSRVSVIQADFRDANGVFDVVTFRALAPLDRFLAESAGPAGASRTGPAGASRAGRGPRWRVMIAYKGRKERALEECERAAASLSSPPVYEIRPLRTPFLDEERCIVVLRKAGPDVSTGAQIDKHIPPE
jgi:16S rRNA (guanine527-N7)-methyltransferase